MKSNTISTLGLSAALAVFACLGHVPAAFAEDANDVVCDTADSVHRWVTTKLHSELEGPTAGTIKVYYELLAPFDPAKPTLLLINGGPGGDHHLLGAFQGAPFTAKMNVLSFDHRGIGCTQITSPTSTFHEPGLYSMARAADDLEAIRKDLMGENGKWFLWGYSYGTMLGQQYAIKYPRNISGMILDGAFYDTKSVDVARKQFLTLFIRDDAAVSALYDQLAQRYPGIEVEILRKLRELAYSYSDRVVTIRKLLERLTAAADRPAAMAILSAMTDISPPLDGMFRSIFCEELWDYPEPSAFNDYFFWMFDKDCGSFRDIRKPMAFGEDLKKLNIRTYLFGGRYDPVTAIQVMREMHKLIPGSLLWENPFSGHGQFVEKPDCAYKIAQQFFDGAADQTLNALAGSAECQSAPALPAPGAKRRKRAWEYNWLKHPLL